MMKTLHSLGHRNGFTLIELLIVVGIIGILGAIAIPAYIGSQEKARKNTIVGAANAAELDINHWMNSAMKGVLAGSQRALLIEVDTDWSGGITPADMTNGALLAVGGGSADSAVSIQYALARAGEFSPWAGMDLCGAAVPMFISAAVPPVPPANPCTITLSPAIGSLGNRVAITAVSNGPGGVNTASGELLWSSVVTAD